MEPSSQAVGGAVRAAALRADGVPQVLALEPEDVEARASKLLY